MTQIISPSGQKNVEFAAWDIANKYRAGDLVVNTGSIYQANGDIPENTAWAVGATGATWTETVIGGLVTPTTVAALGTQPEGTRAFVTDSLTPASAGFGQPLTGGGSNKTPVWTDGTSWYIG
jgi:hypothetical protein